MTSRPQSPIHEPRRASWLGGTTLAAVATLAALGCAEPASPAADPTGAVADSQVSARSRDRVRPQPPYVDVASFSEHAIVVSSGRWRLPGTLSVPRDWSGGRSSTALLLVAGSGPLDRDARLGDIRILRDLAWGLASRGIAVARYDKRTQVYGDALGSRADDFTLAEETVDDGLAAVAELRRQIGESTPVCVLGHSQGGSAIARFASRDRSLRGFVVLAGATRPFEDVLVSQMHYLAQLDGQLSSRESELLAALRAQGTRVKSLRPGQSVSRSLLPLGRGARFWLDLAAHPPSELLRGERRPFLVLHADRDYHVTVEDLRGWQRILRTNEQAKFKRYPSLNHLFMAGSGASTPMEYSRSGHVAAEVIDDVATWLHEVASPATSG